MRPPPILPVRWIQGAKKSAGEPREGENTITFASGPIRISSPFRCAPSPLRFASTHRIDTPLWSNARPARSGSRRRGSDPVWSTTSRPNTRCISSSLGTQRSSNPGGLLLCLRAFAGGAFAGGALSLFLAAHPIWNDEAPYPPLVEAQPPALSGAQPGLPPAPTRPAGCWRPATLCRRPGAETRPAMRSQRCTSPAQGWPC